MTLSTKIDDFFIRKAEIADVSLVLDFIKKLAAYERLSHEVVATEEQLAKYLFGEEQVAEVVIGYYQDVPVGFALYFYNFSTFLAKPGIYLEDLYVPPEHRGKGAGKALLIHIASIAIQNNCGRFEWSVLDWNTPSIEFYKALGAREMSDWHMYRVDGEALQKLADKE